MQFLGIQYTCESPEDPGLDRLGAELGRRGFAPTAVSVTDSEAFRVAWEAWIERCEPDDVHVALIAAHGELVETHDGKRVNALLREPSSPDHVDLDELVASVRGAGIDALILVDACQVELRSVRSATARSVVACLGAPDGDAEVIRGRGVLTKVATRVLRAAPGSLPVHSFLRLVDGAVRADTNHRQQPRVVQFGPAPTWKLRAPAGTEALAPSEELAAQCLVGELTDAQLALWGRVAGALEEAEGARVQLVVDAEMLLREGAGSSDDASRQQRCEERAARLMSALPRHAGGVRDLVRARAAHILGWWQLRQGESPFRVASTLEDALEMLPADLSAAERLRAQVFDSMGHASLAIGAAPRALEYFARSIALKRAAGDTLGLNMSWGSLGWSLLDAGRFMAGSDVFRDALQDCLALIATPSRCGNPRELVGVVDSIAFHALGLLHGMAIVGAPKQEFIALRSQLAPWRALREPLESWSACAGVWADADALLTVLLGGATKRSLGPVWDAYTAYQREGSGDTSALTPALLSAASGDVQRLRVAALAAASRLYYSARSQRHVDVLQRVIEAIRQKCPTVDPPEAPPWALGRARGIDTSDWCRWGPLQAAVAAASDPSVVVYPTITEQYLQVLCWVHGVVLCAEAGIRPKKALSALLDAFQDRSALMLGLRLGMTLACWAAEKGKFRREAGQRLAQAWQPRTLQPFVDAGYVDPQAIYQERNDYAHARPLQSTEMDDLLARHQSVISGLSSIWDLEGLELHRGKRLCDGLYSVRILAPGGKKYDCGVLMACRADPADGVFIPRHIPVDAPAPENIQWNGLVSDSEA